MNPTDKLAVLSDEEANAVILVLQSRAFQMLIGAEEWDLSEEEEEHLWTAIKKIELEVNA